MIEMFKKLKIVHFKMYLILPYPNQKQGKRNHQNFQKDYKN